MSDKAKRLVDDLLKHIMGDDYYQDWGGAASVTYDALMAYIERLEAEAER